MSELFVCSLARDARAGVPPGIIETCLARVRPDAIGFYSDGPFSAGYIGDNSCGRICTARQGRVFGIGDVRLDTECVEGGGKPASRKAIEQLVRRYVEGGAGSLKSVSGDYACLVWDGNTGDLWVLRDWLGLRRLFMRETSWGWLWSADAEPLVVREELNEWHVGQYLARTEVPTLEECIWAEVKPVAPGVTEKWSLTGRTGVSQRKLSQRGERRRMGSHEATQEFRRLFDLAVQTLVADPACTWSELSGGLDSSSIVVTAHTLGLKLGGTYTAVDALDQEDQRPYFSAVVNRTGVRNEEIANFALWQENDSRPPPRTDEPRMQYVMWARNAWARDLVRDGGGTVLLGGDGSDNYLGDASPAVAEYLRRGRWLSALTLGHRLARSSGRSAWQQLWRHGIQPLLPSAIARSYPIRKPPFWLADNYAIRLKELASEKEREGIERRGDYWGRLSYSVANLRAGLEVQPYGDYLERRYPFLWGPLLEFWFGLHVDTAVGLGQHKWVLRSAMKERLPSIVAARITKDGLGPRFFEALREKAGLIKRLLTEPMLADYGIIEPAGLKRAVEEMRVGVRHSQRYVLGALSLETWLRVRSGRWPS